MVRSFFVRRHGRCPARPLALDPEKSLRGHRARRHSAGVRRYSILLVAATVACSSSMVVLPKRSPLRVVGELATDERPAGTVFRDELTQAVAAGLGYFLRHIEVRAVTRMNDLGQPEFVGFEILSLRPAEDWLKFDFAPGDVVTRVDGVSVEHYDSVIPMFEGLAKKDRFEVEIVRGGEPRTILVNIRNRKPTAAAAPISG